MKEKDSDKLLRDLVSVWEESRLRVTDEFSVPPVMLWIDNSIIGTLGNFSASTGKAKSKKTFNVCALTAAALKNGTVLHYTAKMPRNKSKILYVDTEQSPFHCKQVIGRILQLAGMKTDVHPDNLEFLSLRRYSTKLRLSVIELAIYKIDELGLVIIDGIRDLAYDINSPGESTDLISHFMKWTDERQIHIHTVLHLNKGDDNTRGHLGTELNNKAETILQVKKDDLDKDVSVVFSSCIRDIDFEPFAFRINENSLPEIVADYKHSKKDIGKAFDYHEVSEAKHREALELLFKDSETISYKELIGKLQESYTHCGFTFGINKAKQLKVFLENKLMIIKNGRVYSFNPAFHY